MRDTFSGRGNIQYYDFTSEQKEELKETIRKYLTGAESVDIIPAESLKQVRESYAQFKNLNESLQKESEENMQFLPAPGVKGVDTEEEQEDVKDGADTQPLVGDEERDDGSGFHIGQAPTNAKPPEIPSSPLKGDGVSTPIKAGESLNRTATLAAQADKNVAFHEYKRTAGSAFNTKLLNVLRSLRTLKFEIMEKGKEVNVTKASIDKLKAEIAAMKSQRGPSVASDGREVVDAEEVRPSLHYSERLL